MFSSGLNRLNHGDSRTNTRRQLRRAVQRALFEGLENRTMLSTVVWSGAVDNVWTNPGNWQGNVAPVAGDDLVFPASPTRTITVNNLALGTTFNSVTISGAGYSIYGLPMNLDAGITQTTAAGSNSYLIDTTLNNGAVAVSTGGTLDISGVISGAAGVTKTGGGTLSFSGSGANVYTGPTTVNAGTLVLSKDSGAVAVPDSLVIGDGVGTDRVRATSADQLALTSDVTVNTSGTLDLNGNYVSINNLAMTGGTVATGVGTLTLGGNLTVNANATSPTITGTVNLGSTSHTVSVADGAAASDLVIDATLYGLGSSLVKTGAGQLKLKANNAFDSGLTISGGSVVGVDMNTFGTGTITVASGATFELPSAGVLSNNLNIAGASAVHSASGTITLAGTLTLSASATITVDAGQVNLVGQATDAAQGYTLTKAGAGTLKASNNNTLSGPLTISGGTLIAADSGALGTGVGTVTVAAGTTLVLDGGITVASPILSGGTIQSASGSNTASGTLQLTANNVIQVDAGALTLSGVVSDGGGSRSLQKTGAGTLVLSAADTYTGLTNITGGTLRVTGSLASNVSLGGAVVLEGTGTVGEISSAGATVMPGVAGAATLASNGLLLDAASTLTFDLQGNTPGSGAGHHDQVAVIGAVDLGGATLSLSLGGGYVPGPGDSLVLVDNDGVDAVAGTFDGLPEGAAVTFGPNMSFRITYAGGTGNDVELVYVQDSTTTVTSNHAPSVHGQSVTLTATVTASVGTPTGMVQFFDNGDPIGAPVALDGSGVATYTSAALSTGTHLITVAYGGDLSDAPSVSAVFTQVVDKANTTSALVSGTNPTVYGQSTTLTATVAAAAPGVGTPAGTVSLYDGVTLIAGPTALDGGGQATFAISNLSVATHSLTVVYAGNGDFNTSTSAVVNQVVNQASTTTTVTNPATPSVYGQSITLTATVAAAAPGAGVASGTVDFFDNGAPIGTATLNGAGAATLSLSNLAVGNHANITAVYNADASFAGSTSGAFGQVVNQASTASAVTSSASPTVYGQSVTFTATVGPVAPGAGVPTGSVDFYDGVTLLGTVALDGSGQATFTTGALSVATHSITVVYAGDASFAASTSGVTSQVVNPAATSATVVSNHNPAVHGQSITYTVTVSATAPGAGTPSGNALFVVDGIAEASVALDGSGQATLTTAALSTASHTVRVLYLGDGNFTPANSNTITQAVNRAATTTALTSSQNPSASGEATTLTATVAATAPGAGTPTGTVTFYDGASAIGAPVALVGGAATLSVSIALVGGHNITVVYNADGDFTASTSNTVVQTVNQAGSDAGLVIDNNASVYGESVTLTATISAAAPGAGIPTGTVRFYDGPTLLGTGTLAGGVATLTLSSLAVGVHNNLTALYNGDAYFLASAASAPVTDAVGQASTTAAVTSSANPSVNGQSVTLTATILAAAPGAGTPTGTVDFFDGVTLIGSSALTAGVGTLSVSNLAVGAHSITAVYAGDANFTGTTSPVATQTVNQASTGTALTSSVNPSVFGQSTTLTATVTATAPGAGTPTGTVDFFDGVALIGSSALDGSGVATLAIANLAVGSHSLTAVYNGDSDFVDSTSSVRTHAVDQASSTTTLTSGVNPSVFGQSTTLTATVAAAAPGAGTPGGTVQFFDGVTSLGSAALAGGVATLAVANLAVGSHSITVVYSGDTNFTGSTSAVTTQTVNQAASSATLGAAANPSVYGESVTLTATITATAPGAGTPTGTVSFFDGATLIGSGTLNGGGVATLSVSSLSVGAHNLTAVYAGDASFTGATSPVTPDTVNQASTTAIVTSDDASSVQGQGVTFSATVSPVAPGAGTPTGTVQFYDGVAPIGAPVAVVAGVATLTYAGLSTADHPQITAQYSGDANFNGTTSANFDQQVDKDNTVTTVTSGTNPSVVGQSVTLTATVTAAAPGAGIPTGTVQFFDGLAALGAPVALDGSGQATITTSALILGGHSITAQYIGDSDFLTSTSAVTTQTVDQAATTTALASSVNPTVFGQSTTLTATVAAAAPGSGTPTGTVTFFDGNVQLGAPVALVGGVAALSVSGLAVGPHANLTAVYSADADYTASTSSTVSQTVNQASSNAALAINNNASVYGESVTLTATITATAPGAGTPTGTVSFYDGATLLGTGTLAGGVATLSTAALEVGAHNSLTAIYDGDASFAASAASAPVADTVGQASTTVAVTSSVSPSVRGQAVTLTATVAATAPGAGTATGTVSFFDGVTLLGTTALSAGAGSLTVSALAVGAHSITAVYAGDANFTGSTSPVTAQTVDQASTSTTLTSAQNPSVFGQSTSLAATVAVTLPGSGTATGIVDFFDGLALLGTAPVIGGVATLPVSSLSIGAHSLTAVYSGDGDFIGSTSATETQTVNQASSGTSVTSSANPSVYGQAISLAVTVSASAPGAGIPSGTVQAADDGVLIGNPVALDGSGQATIALPVLAAGPHQLTVVYSGDTQFITSTSAPVAQVVSAASTTTAMTSSSNPTIYGESVTFTATVAAVAPGAGIPTGMVQFFDNGLPIADPVAVDNAGAAQLVFSILGADVHTITATYAGDANFGTSGSAGYTQTVDKASSLAAVTTDVASSMYGQPITVTATLSAVAPGAGTPTGTVQFFIDGILAGTGTLANGVATFTTSSLALGNHDFTAVYGGDANFLADASNLTSVQVNAATTTNTLTASANPSVTGQSVTFTATISPDAPASGTATGLVDFFDGPDLITSVPLSNGSASITLSSLALGTHSITAVYGGDGNFTGSASATANQTVNAAATTVAVTPSASPSVTGEAVTFSVTVAAAAPGSGTPNGLVSLFDNAVLLGTAPLFLGQASFTYAMSVGNHSITAIYSGDPDYLPGSNLSSPLAQVVDPASTVVSLSATPSPSVFGQSVLLSAQVTVAAPGAGAPTGTVSFFDGATILGIAVVDNAGSATLTTGGLQAGSRSITAVYSGDASFAPSTSAPVTQPINAAATATTLQVSTATTNYGSPVTLTAQVTASAPSTATAAGTVSFYDGLTLLGTGTLDNSGVATLSTTTLPVGHHANLTAVFNASASFLTSTSSAGDVVITNNNPTTTGITPVNVLEDADPTPIDLADFFGDPEDGAGGLTYTIVSNSDPTLFAMATITGHTLALDYVPDANGSATLTVRATDSGDLWVESTFTVTISPVNDAPAFTAGPDEEINENDGPQTVPGWATNFSSGPADESAQTLHFVITDVSDPSLFADLPAISDDGTLTYTPADNTFGSATVTVQLVDDGGTALGGEDVSTQTFTITINEVPDTAPTVEDLTVNHTPGSSVTIDALSHASDPDPDTLTLAVETQPAGGQVAVDDQGTEDPSDDVLVYTPTPGFYGPDSFTYSVDDGRGGVSVATVTITVSGAGYAVNPVDPSKRDLVILGTAGNDVIKVADVARGRSGAVSLSVNGVSKGTFLPSGRIVVFGGNGNDTLLTVDVHQTQLLFGGAGNDKITSSVGVSILSGGTGNDTLTSGLGRDILIGGAGKDSLFGLLGGDVLIGGTTDYDADTVPAREALNDLLTAWTARTKIAARVAVMQAGFGTSNAKLTRSTVHDDAQQDTLLSADTADWYFARRTGAAKDLVKTFHTGDAITWL